MSGGTVQELIAIVQAHILEYQSRAPGAAERLRDALRDLADRLEAEIHEQGELAVDVCAYARCMKDPTLELELRRVHVAGETLVESSCRGHFVIVGEAMADVLKAKPDDWLHVEVRGMGRARGECRRAMLPRVLHDLARSVEMAVGAAP